MSGVAKSASDAADTSRKALATPGVVSGKVTVRNTRQRRAPRLNAESSRFASTLARTALSVRYAIGK